MTHHVFKMQDTNPENKLRLLMIYATVYPEKFEGDKGVKLMQVAFRVIETPCNAWNNLLNKYCIYVISLLDYHLWI